MTVLLSSLSALITGVVRAAKAMLTEIVPPAVTGDVAGAACASVAWFVRLIWSVLIAAVATVIGTLPYAAAVVSNAAHALQLLWAMALKLLSYFWGLSSAVVTGAAHVAKALATLVLPATVALVTSVIKVAWAWAAWFAGNLWSFLAAAASVASETLPRVALAAWNALQSTLQASQPWLDTATNMLYELHGWPRTMVVDKLPDAAEAAKNAAWSLVQASQPWLEMALELLRDLYGRLVRTTAAAETPPVGDAAASYSCAAVCEKQLRDAAAAAALRMDCTAAEAAVSGQHAWSWFARDHGVAVHALLAFALVAISFLCGVVCARSLRPHAQEGRASPSSAAVESSVP